LRPAKSYLTRCSPYATYSQMKEYPLRFDIQEELLYTWAHRGYQSHISDPFLPIEGRLPFIPDVVISKDRKTKYEEYVDFELDRAARKIRRIENGAICSGEEVLLIKNDDDE
jgi:hypothetical protein